MKTNFASILIIVMMAISTMTMWANPEDQLIKKKELTNSDQSDKIAIAYVTDRYPDIPDADMFTHLIHAFGVFNDNQDGVVIRYPEKLKELADLKKKNPKLKVILGLNDYRRPGFCEMADDKKKRKAYVKSIKKVVKTYNLDGVDLDWEFPTIEGGGHNFTPEDDQNYVLLAKDLRKALGKDAWISYYSNNSGQWIDHKGMLPYVSYVNVSGYNLAAPREGEPMRHQSALYPSEKTGDWCVSKVIERHIGLGIPKEKILMGIPLFGKGLPPFPQEVDWIDFSKYSSGLQMKWDDDAQAPYFSDMDGNLILGFDDARSIAAKFDFIRSNGLPGIFIWSYESDFNDHRLCKVIEKLRKGMTSQPAQVQSSD